MKSPRPPDTSLELNPRGAHLVDAVAKRLIQKRWLPGPQRKEDFERNELDRLDSPSRDMTLP